MEDKTTYSPEKVNSIVEKAKGKPLKYDQL